MAEAATPSNGYDRDELRSYVDRIGNLTDEIGSIMSEAMTEAKARRKDISEIYVEAKARGIPVKALRCEVRLQDLDKKKVKIVAKLDEDDLSSLEAIQEALGEFASTAVEDDAVKAARDALAG